MNKFELLKSMMTKGMTPKGLVMNMAGNNPIIKNLIEMADKGDKQGIETFARNVLNERGVDFDKEYEAMKKTFNIQ